MNVVLATAFLFPVLLFTSTTPALMRPDDSAMKIMKCQDFKVSGDGSNEAWRKTAWVQLTQRGGLDKPLNTIMKVLYSDTGMYFLFNSEDKLLTATMSADFMDLWVEDVVEIFLWPDESMPAYFEYELSPLNYELPILISNENDNLTRWQPFHYEADRKTQHATSVTGGEKKSKSPITGWTAEIFIPYALMRPLNNIKPSSGTRWRGNFYRVDYDNGRVPWSWQLTTKNFHEYQRFGTLIFE
jgi:Carbohydrate family 9 binding domain-like